MLGPIRHGIVPDVRKIAVLRAGGIGDLIFALPALDAIRTAYPHAAISLLGAPWQAGFVDRRPGPVDRVVPVPPARGVYAPDGGDGDPAQLERFFAAMRRERFDLAVQMHGAGTHSNAFVLQLGARLTAGLRGTDAPSLDRCVPYLFYQSEIVRGLEVAALIGAAPGGIEPRIAVTAGDVAESRRVVPDGDRPLAALHPGASDPRRRWPPEKFAAAGDALARAGACVVITGGGEDRGLTRAVKEAMARDAADLSGRLSLGGLTGLLSRCAVVVSNDTGPLHLAAAAGTPTVGVYWCGNVITACELTRTVHRPAISWRLTCPDCGQDCTRVSCGHRPSFVADVPEDEVIGAALDLLARRPDGET